MTQPISLSHLRSVAEGATPGQWAAEYCQATPVWHIEAGAYPYGTTICEIKQSNEDANAAYIAAANPATVLTLLDIASAVQKVVAFSAHNTISIQGDPKDWDALRAALKGVAP